MPSTAFFNRQLFAKLLKKAIGDRSINQFALHCGVSAAYVSRLLRQITPNPPNPPIIAKFANKAHNNITYTELMEAAGYLAAVTLSDEHLIYEKNPAYAPDLADVLNQSMLKYKGYPVDNDTRNIILAILARICPK